jgi:hypothetical protein
VCNVGIKFWRDNDKNEAFLVLPSSTGIPVRARRRSRIFKEKTQNRQDDSKFKIQNDGKVSETIEANLVPLSSSLHLDVLNNGRERFGGGQ